MIRYPLRFCLDNLRRAINIPSKPFLINYSLTFRCGFKCKHCGVWGLENDYAQEELRASEVSRFLGDKSLKQLGVIVITGGEPFLKDDFVEILLEFKQKTAARIFHITTNGFLTEKIIESVRFLKSRGVNLDLKISIDDIGLRHDELRDKEDSFKKAVNTITKLRSAFGKKDLFIGINQTIYEENYKSIPLVKKLACELEVAYFGFIGLKRRALYSNKKESDFGLTNLSNSAKLFISEELVNGYSGRMSLNNFSEIMESIVIKHYIKGQLDLLNNKMLRHRCMNLFSHFRLNPNGDILTCSYDTDVLGNLRQESYSSILKKPKSLAKLNKVKNCGKCWLGCEVTPSRAASLFMA